MPLKEGALSRQQEKPKPAEASWQQAHTTEAAKEHSEDYGVDPDGKRIGTTKGGQQELREKAASNTASNKHNKPRG